jgi:hypothetical protein
VKKRRYILVGERDVLRSSWAPRKPDPEIEEIVKQMEYKLLRHMGLISPKPPETGS